MLMHGQLNGTNLKVEVGDNFMSDYQTYIKYAKKSIRELEQLADIKKTLKGKKLAEKIRELGLKWITKSAVDSVLHGLGENNGFSNLNSQQKQVAEKLASLKDTALTHKSSSIQGVIDENAEMAQSDVTKLIDYSEKLQSMFNVNDNLEDWVKAKLNHACDYVATVRDYLKFYSEEKEKGTQNIEEKWTNTYKKSINCSNPKGFSQKAHCRARKLRQAGKDTKSKPVKECYKEAIQELLREQNSSMAMGALKQINNDAKELQSMLQPTTQLEDWVKSKLNLAGEYLDDVYHHLDHFGPEGRKLDEGYYDDKDRERQQRRLRFSSTILPEKKYWFTPSGTVAEAGYSHEDWIKENDPSLVGRTLIDTYDNAVKKGYIRAVLDTSHNFLTLSNLQNYDFSMNGNTNQNVPAVKSSVLDAIRNFIAEKGILITATGKGNIIKDLTSIDESKLSEGVKDWLAAGALGLGALTGNVDAAKLPPTVPIVQTSVKDSELSLLNKKTSDYIAHWEGKRDKVYNDSEGKPTIGIGHYLNSSEQDRNLFKTLFGNTVDYNKVLNGQQKLSSDQIEKLFNVDVKVKEKLASSIISNFNSLPNSVKNAIINALYRGDLGPKTIGLINSGKWDSVAKEYLDHKNARTGPEQIKRRMNTNAMAFAQFAKNKG